MQIGWDYYRCEGVLETQEYHRSGDNMCAFQADNVLSVVQVRMEESGSNLLHQELIEKKQNVLIKVCWVENKICVSSIINVFISVFAIRGWRSLEGDTN